MKEELTIHTGFYELFEPTADLVYDCTYNREGAEVSAILQSILLIEAAANCCLFGLGLGRKLRNELDKLPIFAKLDTYLLVKSGGNQSLDRGLSICQDISELIWLRNSVVHPKAFKMRWSIADDEHQTGTGIYEKTERLKIATTCTGWSAEDAISAFKVVNLFINYYFKETCGLSDQETRLLLLTVEDDDAEDIWIDSKRLRSLQDDYSIPLKIWGVGGKS